MVQNNSDSSSHQLLDDEARSLAELLLGRPSNEDVVLDLSDGEIDLSSLEDSLQQSDMLEALRQQQQAIREKSQVTHSPEQMKVIISRSVFGRPEPAPPVISAPTASRSIRSAAVRPAPVVTSRTERKPDGGAPGPARTHPGPFFSHTVQNDQQPAITLERPASADRVEGSRSGRSRKEIPALATGEQRRSRMFRLLISVFAVGLIGAAASTAYVRFTADTATDPSEPTVVSPTTPPPTAVATTQPPTSAAPTSVPTTPTTLVPSSTVPVETQLTVPNVNGSRPSWAPDPEP